MAGLLWLLERTLYVLWNAKIGFNLAGLVFILKFKVLALHEAKRIRDIISFFMVGIV